jgi:hypothetical protein
MFNNLCQEFGDIRKYSVSRLCALDQFQGFYFADTISANFQLRRSVRTHHGRILYSWCMLPEHFKRSQKDGVFGVDEFDTDTIFSHNRRWFIQSSSKCHTDSLFYPSSNKWSYWHS